MTDTDYATLDELKDRLNLDPADDPPEAMLQGLLNSAARVVDAVSRPPICRDAFWPYPAFSATAAIARAYPDPYMDQAYPDPALGRVPPPLPIDDLLTVTSITRGGTALVADTDYVLTPYGTTLPKTGLVIAGGAGTAATRLTVWQNVVVTGTWGYCAIADRPPEVAEATLLQAVIFYQRYGLDVETLANAMGDPLKAADATVAKMLWGVTRR